MNFRKMALETKISIMSLAIISLILIVLSIQAKEILGVLSGVIFWIIIKEWLLDY